MKKLTAVFLFLFAVFIASGQTFEFEYGKVYNIASSLKGNKFIAVGDESKAKPVLRVINSNDFKVIAGQGDFVEVRNLHIVGKMEGKNAQVAAIEHWNGGIVIDGCIIENFKWGIRLLKQTNESVITNTIIRNIWDDGIYTKNIKAPIRIEGCHISEVNMGYWHPVEWQRTSKKEPWSGGDCIQIDDEQDLVIIKNNVLDRSASGRKFALILGDDNVQGTPDIAIIEGNTFIGSNYSRWEDYGWDQKHDNVTAIYIKKAVQEAYVKNNYFVNFTNGSFIHSGSKNLEFVCNFVENCVDASSSADAIIANNILSEVGVFVQLM